MINQHKFLQKFALGCKYYNLFGHLLCILCLNGSKKCFIYVFKLTPEKLSKISARKEPGNQSGLCEKKMGGQNFFKILGEPKPLTLKTPILGSIF